jgi:DNA-binding transcriptional ArsR family regulator
VDVVENVGDTLIRERVIPFEMTQPVVSRHLKVLASAGLIVRRVEGTKRPCRLAKAGVEAIDQWLAMLRDALARNYDRLDEILADMKLENRREIR